MENLQNILKLGFNIRDWDGLNLARILWSSS